VAVILRVVIFAKLEDRKLPGDNYPIPEACDGRFGMSPFGGEYEGTVLHA